MRISPSKIAGLWLCGCLAAVAPGQNIPSDNPPPPGLLPAPTAADHSWAALLAAQDSATQGPAQTPGDAATRIQAQAERAGRSRAVADQAKIFYTANPTHDRTAEARNVEIFSLIASIEDGDATVTGRLGQAVADLRADLSIPVKIRAKGVAAHEFTRAWRGLNSRTQRMETTERIARDLIREFPTEPQGYEALLACGQADVSVKSEQIARELIVSNAPEDIRKSAQGLLDRSALVGSALSAVLGVAGADLLAALPSGEPVIVYSWATWGPGSIELGRMIQARRFAAIGICLDEQVEAAKKAEHAEGLGGKHLYDAQGRQGSMAGRLNFNTAGQIYLVDAQGVIRDVRGGEDLETKLAALGFKTPVLVKP